MKIGVLSDTHGHLENLQRALKALGERGVDVICHLGDDYDDIKAVKVPSGAEVVQVPGVFSPYYRDPKIPNRLLKHWEGWRFLLTHTRARHENDLPSDPDPEELSKRGEVEVVFYGHSHVPEVRVQGGVLFLNPGHLKDDDKKGHPPTYGLVEVEEGWVLGRVFDLYSGEVLYEGRVER